MWETARALKTWALFDNRPQNNKVTVDCWRRTTAGVLKRLILAFKKAGSFSQTEGEETKATKKGCRGEANQHGKVLAVA